MKRSLFSFAALALTAAIATAGSAEAPNSEPDHAIHRGPATAPADTVWLDDLPHGFIADPGTDGSFADHADWAEARLE